MKDFAPWQRPYKQQKTQSLNHINTLHSGELHMSNKIPVTAEATKYPAVETVNNVAGGVIPFDAVDTESPLETPPGLNVSDFDYNIGEIVDLPPPESASLFERLIEDNDLLPVWFLERGVDIQKAVARVVLTRSHRGLAQGRGWGTGFMISPSFFLTNNHVVSDKEFMTKFRVQFNYQLDFTGVEQLTESFQPIANNVFHTNKALDYSLIQLEKNNQHGSELPGERWGYIPLNAAPLFYNNQHFNIIQHPSGRLKEISLQDNEISQLRVNAVRYTGDTEPGSSGSPVFNNLWELVALHHAGGEKDATGKWINNQGIRIDRIVADLQQHFAHNAAVLTELGI